ncbi:MAG: FAD-dependent oxidoreductase [Chitinophagaceae bacterium]|nr:FAD-dependent oxidoreductase [Chitinophagaceae bacterium]
MLCRQLLKCCIVIYCLSLCNVSFSQKKIAVDICVYGGTSSGVIAAYTAKKMGKTVVLIEPGKRLGGLTSGGLGYTDIGNKFAISGLALDYYRRIGNYYGKFEQWIFEPHIAENLFKQYIQSGAVNVLYTNRLKSVSKDGTAIKTITVENSDKPNSNTDYTITAKVFIDCSYEGDLMAKSGVSYTVGRESNNTYGELYNGVQLRDKHQFRDSIDPYKVKGDPKSGLLWGISSEEVAAQGSGDKKVQTYNFRICLTSDPANQIPITRPDDYDAARYELLIRVLEKEPNRPFDLIMKPDLMPNQKTDINNNGPFSTDMIGMNHDYPEGGYEKRKEIQKAHESYTKGLLYFIGHDPRMPKHLRDEMLKWGYPKDEYTDNNNWTPQMYIRECRRMIGDYVMTQANCEGKEIVTDGVGMAAYTMDSHNCQRIVIEKDGVMMVKNEGDVQVGGFPPYPVAYRSLTPKAAECTNLLVPVCLSASHIAYGSIRMEPVFMVMGQAAATAATLAIDKQKSVQDINIPQLQSILRNNPFADGSQPDILIDNEQDENITVTGNWQTVKGKGSYASSSLQISNSSEANAVKFTPVIIKEAKYKVYSYTPKISGGSSTIHFKITNEKETALKTINLNSLKVEGQTSGEWLYVGEYIFKPGATAAVEITAKESNGIVIADAVLFVPERK